MRNRFSCWTAVSLSGLLGCSAAATTQEDSEQSLTPTQAAQEAHGAAAGSSASASAANTVGLAMKSAQSPAGAAVPGTQPFASQGIANPAASRAAAGSAAASGAKPSIPATTTTPAPQETFDAVGTNPFVVAARVPFSTFAADVDTASYDVFRRNMEPGAPVDKDSVRLEKFVNYFQYDYPAPEQSDEHPFRIHTALAQNPFGHETTLLRVGIQARMPQPDQRKQANLVFLIDTSGSMLTEDKLPLVQYLLTQSLDVLNSDDKVSIVTYAGSTAVRLEPTSVLEKDKISAVIQGLSAGGSTNGAGGIQLAYQQAENAFLQDGINHVILCTDGDFNVGVSNTDELVRMIKDKRTSGITLTTLGFGFGNLNDAMMEKVSNAGNGMYSVITSRTQASRYAEDRMLRTFLHVAKDMKIQLEWNPEKVEAYRLIGYEDRAIAVSRKLAETLAQYSAGEVGRSSGRGLASNVGRFSQAREQALQAFFAGETGEKRLELHGAVAARAKQLDVE